MLGKGIKEVFPCHPVSSFFFQVAHEKHRLVLGPSKNVSLPFHEYFVGLSKKKVIVIFFFTLVELLSCAIDVLDVKDIGEENVVFAGHDV